MYCEHLSLTNFRNYARLECDFPPETTLIIGPNAQGKTNLLEAVYYLATTRSFRTSAERELVALGIAEDEVQFTRVRGRVRRAKDTVALEITLQPARLAQEADAAEGPMPMPPTGPAGKRIKVNGVPRRALDLFGQVNVVVFAPTDVDLVCGPPAGRRRYLDITISQIDPRYVRTLALYNKIVTRRNGVLRLMKEGRARADQLGYWDEELVTAGAFIIARRATAIESLSRLAESLHRDLTNLHERLLVAYAPNLAARDGDTAPIDGSTEPDLADRFRRALRAALPREAAIGQSLVGPHRDDLLFHVDGVDMTAFGSRGQQRTVALSLKLAELQLMRETTGQLPILLLDDVMSELDEMRRARVLSAIVPGQQVLATATDLTQFDPGFAENAHVIRVRRGTVARG